MLEPGLPLLLDCNLGASEAPFNVSWLRDGRPLPLAGGDFVQYLDNGSLLLLPAPDEGDLPRALEGGYSCVSASALGALTSRTVNVLLASKCPATARTAVARRGLTSRPLPTAALTPTKSRMFGENAREDLVANSTSKRRTKMVSFCDY